MLWLISFAVAFSWPFYDLSQRFNEWAEARAEICEKHVDFWVSEDLPAELVAFKGSDKSEWNRGSSSRDSWWETLILMPKVRSLAVYDPTQEERIWGRDKPLDGVEGRWKKTVDGRCWLSVV